LLEDLNRAKDRIIQLRQSGTLPSGSAATSADWRPWPLVVVMKIVQTGIVHGAHF
jgi:hypothetical protein